MCPRSIRPFAGANLRTATYDYQIIVTKLSYRCHNYVPTPELPSGKIVLNCAAIDYLRQSAKDSSLLNVSGRRIKQFRTHMESGWTQARLARALQLEGMAVDRSGVAKIEGGYRKISDVEIVIIAKTLGVTPNQLLPNPSDRLVRDVLQDSYRAPRSPRGSAN